MSWLIQKMIKEVLGMTVKGHTPRWDRHSVEEQLRPETKEKEGVL